MIYGNAGLTVVVQICCLSAASATDAKHHEFLDAGGLQVTAFHDRAFLPTTLLAEEEHLVTHGSCCPGSSGSTLAGGASSVLLQRAVQRREEGIKSPVLTFKTRQSILAISTAETTAGKISVVPVIIFLVVLGVLAAGAVGLYLRSMVDEVSPEPVEAAAQGTEAQRQAFRARRAQSMVMGEEPPSKGSPSRRLVRSHSITIAELKDRYWTIEDSNESMSSAMFVVNMFADLGPPGFLPLAYGLRDTGYIPGFIMLVVFYVLCVYTMYAISRCVQLTGCKDFSGQWSATIGERTSWVPVAALFLLCLGCNLSYACFFADIFTGVMPWLGLRMPRYLCLIAFTVFPTMPLCLLKNLSALSYSSSFALVAVLYTAGVMVARAVDGSYAEGGRFRGDMAPALAPSVPDSHLSGFGLPSLVLVNTLAMAFISHYNGCKYYRELEGHTPTKLVKCTATAMGICVILFAVTMVAGFQTFGTHADGVILKNYSRQDPLANLARLGMGFSLIASFPLMFSGLREATINLLKIFRASMASEFDLVWVQDIISMVLLTLITVLALLITDAGLVVGVVGALCGSACIYIVPCTLYAAAIKGFMATQHNFTLLFLRCLTVLGAFLAIAGCYTSLAL